MLARLKFNFHAFNEGYRGPFWQAEVIESFAEATQTSGESREVIHFTTLLNPLDKMSFCQIVVTRLVIISAK